MLAYGSFIQTVVNFLIIAFAIFLVVKAANSMKRKRKRKPHRIQVLRPKETLLTEIRDLLAKSKFIYTSFDESLPFTVGLSASQADDGFRKFLLQSGLTIRHQMGFDPPNLKNLIGTQFKVEQANASLGYNPLRAKRLWPTSKFVELQTGTMRLRLSQQVRIISVSFL